MISEVRAFPHQREFIESEALSTGLVAGFGAGKTYAGVLKTIVKKMAYPSVKVAYYLPTYPHIRDIAFVAFPEMCKRLGLDYSLNHSAKELHIHGFGTIIMRNMSQPEFIIGYEVGYSLIDECDIEKKAKMDLAYKKILARNRAPLPNRERNLVDVVGTPEGFKWFYDKFVTNKTDKMMLIRASTYDNPTLPDDYITSLEEEYDPLLLRQYLMGEFVNVNGNSVYHQFDRDDHVIDDIAIDTSLPLIITFDFNIDPYNAIYLIQEINGVTTVIDNAIIKNKALIYSLVHLKEKFAYLGDYLFTAKVYGDSTGDSRNSGTPATNYDLIKEAGFHNLLIKTKNPYVEDRNNAFNSRLRNGLGRVSMVVCSRNGFLIKDCEQLSYDAKGRVDKSDQALGHSTDSTGYYIEFEFGLNKNKIRNFSMGDN